MGRRVREARSRTDPPVTQVELVARLQLQNIELGQAAISKIEQGTRPVSDIEVLALARALHVPVQWLYGEE